MNMGNTGRVLFMQLLIHHVNNVIKIRFADGVGELGEKCGVELQHDFFGILGFEILIPDAFDSDLVECEIHSLAWARENPAKVKLQSVIKLWTTYGLSESLDSNGKFPAYGKPAVYTFVREKRAQKLVAMNRLNEKRHLKANALSLESALKKHRSEAQDSSDSVAISSLVMLSDSAVPQPHPDSGATLLLQRADALARRAESLEQVARRAEQRADELERGAARVMAVLDRLV